MVNSWTFCLSSCTWFAHDKSAKSKIQQKLLKTPHKTFLRTTAQPERRSDLVRRVCFNSATESFGGLTRSFTRHNAEFRSANLASWRIPLRCCCFTHVLAGSARITKLSRELMPQGLNGALSALLVFIEYSAVRAALSLTCLFFDACVSSPGILCLYVLKD